MRKLRLAVIGAGHLGRIHAKLLSSMDDVELVAVVDPLSTARDSVAADCRTVGLAEHHDLLGRIDGAVIATPTRFHHAVALDFLRFRIPLLVEKPLCSTISQAEELVRAAHEHGAVLQVGHIERFNPALTAALPHVRQPKFIEAVRASGFTFRSTDVGVVLDLMIHDLDVVLSLAASPVRSVAAMGLAVVGRHEDVAHARIEFENGCVANVSASRISPVARRQMQVWSAQGFTTVDFASRAVSVMRPSETLLHRKLDAAAVTPEEKAHLKEHLLGEHLPTETLCVEATNALVDELTDFARAIRTSTAPRVPGEAGLAAMALAGQVLERIAAHAWDGRADGPVGPLAMPPLPILRGPHWERARDGSPYNAPLREAG